MQIPCFQEAKKQAYKLLPAALPLQNKQPVLVKSVFQFTQDEPGQLKEIIKSDEELGIIKQNVYLSSKKPMHSIGDKFTQLFKNYIYKSHDKLNLQDNENFATSFTNQFFKIETQRPIYCTNDNILQFQSRFQSGNLAIVSHQYNNPRNYYLAIQRDYNAKSKTTQWFYFKVKNKSNLGIFSFNIVNYVKPFSMFKRGMKPCVYSVKKQVGWMRGGTQIEYKKNSIPYGQNSNYYTLSFSYNFEQIDDEVYFAYCYPYTYTRLQRYLDSIQSKNSDKLRRKVICKTLGDNVVEMISITNPQYSNKKLLIITARVHPGQTIGSFVCQAIINFLLSNHIDAQKIRAQFIVKIIPMLNPDGVINGNYRTSLSGQDLNRVWKNPLKNIHPQIYTSKKVILESQNKKLIYIDIHGHSKKKATFMYGCISQKSPYLAKEFPYILSKKISHFNYFSCNFNVSKNKEGTSRVVMWRNGIQHSYTYQLSFCCPQKQKRHFNLRDYQNLGIDLCKNLSAYFYSRILELQVNQQLNRHCEDFYDDDQLLNIGNVETNGSSSQLQDEVVKQFCQLPPKRPQSKKVRSINTQKTETKINDLLQGYTSKFNLIERKQISYRGQQQIDISKQILKQKKKNVEKQSYLRQRQSLMATKVNIQQMQLQSNIYTNMSTSYYGFAAETKSVFGLNEPSKKTFYRSSQALKNDKKQKSIESFGVLLPNVEKNHYKKYERYKRQKSQSGQKPAIYHILNQAEYLPNKFHQSNSFYHRNLIKIPHEISLTQRIKSRTTQKR